MGELLKGIGIIAILIGIAWLALLLQATGGVGVGGTTLFAAMLAGTPGLSCIVIGLVLVACGTALDRLKSIAESSERGAAALERLSGDGDRFGRR